ncbi:hypothetical protein MA16_Dca017080 [Dendrobium catenatum]|uniref:Uncharacterized protein n=1 Tax=Dendrobium catenatum TaxID=906689 RepID=A0A2I0VZF3_9ASPA|nr:hypothetical protein MA16_Dca017080 [Dendrobium catenatum]
MSMVGLKNKIKNSENIFDFLNSVKKWLIFTKPSSFPMNRCQLPLLRKDKYSHYFKIKELDLKSYDVH